MSIARHVSKIMDRIAPLTLAEKWDNVSLSHLIIACIAHKHWQGRPAAPPRILG